MAGFTTTSDGGWVFSFADPVEKPELPSGPNMATNYLAGAGKWENYSDLMLYDAECRLRDFFESKRDDKQFNSPKGTYRKFTVKMMFEILYGKPYTSSDQKIANRLSTLMAYYSTKIQKEGTIRGKRHKKKVYTLSFKRYSMVKPYSLRLRLEWLGQRGELPTWRNMMLPKDDLDAGHARNPKTDRNMEKRRERAKRIYNERYADRHH